MPAAVRVASALYLLYGVLGVITGLLYRLLRGHSPISWQFLGLLLFTALFFVIGIKLLQLRYWALIAGRILALWFAASYVLLLATGRFAVSRPVLTVVTVAQFAVILATAVSLFIPGVSEAFKQQAAEGNKKPPPSPPPQAGEGNEPFPYSR
jgi:hypothetical protein